MSVTMPRWAVLTWQEQDGNVYCCNIAQPVKLLVRTDFNRPDGSQLSDVITPRARPVLLFKSCDGEVTEYRRFSASEFQQAIDATQRMVREHRP